jgi:N-acetylglucosaminyldiphosphoundecaprenol N-acetyl-beta-D-mannosaminyltransferase
MEYYLKGTKISLTTPSIVLDAIINYQFHSPNYISIFGLYPLLHSFQNQELQIALNQSLLNPLHGKSLELYIKFKGLKNIKTVDGVFLLDKLLNEKLTHYFYGSSEKTLYKIEEKIKNEYPNALVIGYKQPPMINIRDVRNNKQLQKDFFAINQLRPDIVWVGLGGIKQDLVMYNYYRCLDKSLLIGVGAVFDYFAGNLSLSSERVKKYGLRWLHRGLRQPKLLKKQIEMLRIVISLLFKKTHN